MRCGRLAATLCARCALAGHTAAGKAAVQQQRTGGVGAVHVHAVVVPCKERKQKLHANHRRLLCIGAGRCERNTAASKWNPTGGKGKQPTVLHVPAATAPLAAARRRQNRADGKTLLTVARQKQNRNERISSP